MIKLNKMLGVLLVVMITTTGLMARQQSQQMILTSNLLSLFGVGDLNINIELPQNKDISYLIGTHYNPDTEQQIKTVILGGYAGYRVYTTGLNKLTGDMFQTEDFVQFTLGLNKYSGDEVTMFGSNVVPSIELWYGVSKNFSKHISHEISIGSGRVFNDKSSAKLLVGYNFGLLI